MRHVKSRLFSLKSLVGWHLVALLDCGISMPTTHTKFLRQTKATKSLHSASLACACPAEAAKHHA
jgi:hypothetical protein